jgi:Rod binding domain-containing protein
MRIETRPKSSLQSLMQSQQDGQTRNANAFEQLLKDAQNLGAETSPQRSEEEKQVRKLVQDLISQTFFGPMLRQMRNSPWKSDLWSGGRGGDAFQGMMDQKMVEQMGSAISGPLVDSMTRQLLGHKAMKSAAARQLQNDRLQDQSHVELDRRA